MEEDTECIYDEVRQLVAVSPNKTQYDSKESVLFIFNKPLLVNGGPYEVEFRGESHCLKVPAVLLNSCVIQTHAPVYFPPETTIVTVYDKVKPHEPFVARCTFEFFSRSQVVEELLDKATDPQQLLCDSLGASTCNIKMFDEVIARKIQQKSPHEFHLLEIPQTGQAEAQSNTKYPTLIHFGAAHRLPLTVAACLRYCPAARQACALKNKDGMCPKELAVKHEHYELSEDLQDFQSNEQSYLKNKTQSTELAVNNCNDEENEEEYIMMGPKLALDDSDRQYDNIKTSGAGISKKDITMTPELWKAIFIAEQAVNESWRNSELGEETAKAFSQLIQKSAREHNTDSSLTYDVPRVTGPALPPKSNRSTNKRHSIRYIPRPSCAPPLPPRSPRSPRSAQFFLGM
ncbi:phosphoinositide 3-kinase adapter protein 1-like [Oculina patagonica]